MAEVCQPNHDWFNDFLTAGLIAGLVASYMPQHFKIINKGSSEGFSPWFLLLGATSSGAGMLNMITMQWGVIRCCKYLSAGSCFESVMGIFQVSLQWLLFDIILVLYILYFPPHLKYIEAESGMDQLADETRNAKRKRYMTDDWRLSVTLAWVVLIHIILMAFVTFFLLLTTAPIPSGPGGPQHSRQVGSWATFLGISSAALAAIQYAPQLTHTYKAKLVGALSIPMMIIQSPGAAVMVLSIALRPGTDWTSWIMFAVSGIMQAILLLMCIAWKVRQRRLGIDDFGHPLPSSEASTSPTLEAPSAESAFDEQIDIGGEVPAEETPLLAKPRQQSGQRKTFFERFVGRRTD